MVTSSFRHPAPDRPGPYGNRRGPQGGTYYMRAYELMVIIDSDVEEAGVKAVNAKIEELVVADGGTIAKTDYWGKRRYAYPINHKLEGIYIVFEITTPASNLNEVDRFLRLADDLVRHKVMRLPEAEAERRGLLGTPAVAAE